MNELSITKTIEVRFSEVDSMNIVWHGHYATYFEDAREAFGRHYGLDYLTIYHAGYYAPLVDFNIQYKRPIVYGMRPAVTIRYRATEAAKILFDYEIHDTADGTLLATGHTVQVFLDLKYQLVLGTPPFYQAWKEEKIYGIHR